MSSAAWARRPAPSTLVTSTWYGVEMERPESVTAWTRPGRSSLRHKVGGDPGGPTATRLVVTDPVRQVTVAESGVTRTARRPPISAPCGGGAAAVVGAVVVGAVVVGAVVGVVGAASCPPPVSATPRPIPVPARTTAPAVRSQARFRTRPLSVPLGRLLQAPGSLPEAQLQAARLEERLAHAPATGGAGLGSDLVAHRAAPGGERGELVA